MFMCAHLNTGHNLLERGGRCLQPVTALLTRLTIGWIFFEAGMGKFANLDQVTQNFTNLGIPFPALQAPLVAGVEMIGGLFLMIGLGTRFAAALLAATMVVALATAYREYFSHESAWSELFGLAEFGFVLLFAWLMAMGGGKLSLDTIVVWWIKRMQVANGASTSVSES